ncbi:GSCOCG00000098001-RA-CDS, partial [Cotesia congregata]
KTRDILKTRELTLVETLDNVKCPSTSWNREEVVSNHLIFSDSCANKSQSNPKSNSRNNNNNNNLTNNYLKISTGFNVDEDDGTNRARSGAISRKFDETWVDAEKHSTPSKESISYISRKNPSCSVQSYSYSSLSSSSSCGERSRPPDIKRSDSFLKRFRENWPGCEKFIKNIPSYGKKPDLFIKSKDTDHPVPPVRRKKHKTESGICNTDNNLIIPQNLSLPNEQKDNLVTVSSKKEDTIANYNTDNRLLLINASYSSHKGGTSSQEREHRQEFSPGLQGYSTSQLQSSQCIKLIPDRSKLLEQDYEKRVSRSRSISTDDVDDLINSNDNFGTSNDNNNYCYSSSSSPSNLKLLKNNRKVKSDLDLSYRRSHLNSNLRLKLKRSPSPENNALYSSSGSAEYSDIILRSSDNSVNELRCLNWSNSTTLHSSVSSGYSFSNVSDGEKDIIGDSYYDGYSNTTNSSGSINDNEQKGGKKALKGSEDNLKEKKLSVNLA